MAENTFYEGRRSKLKGIRSTIYYNNIDRYIGFGLRISAEMERATRHDSQRGQLGNAM